MAAGDGLLVRIKPRGGVLTLGQAVGVADLAARFGNGALTLTARANLQIRGVSADGVEALAAGLATLGLLDPSVEAEAVRNVVSSPLAGHDTTAVLDVRPATAALEDELVRNPLLWRLYPKTCWVVDGGGALPLDTVAADVRFEAGFRDGCAGFAIRLAGEGTRAAWCEQSGLADTAVALAQVTLELGGDGSAPSRIRDLVAANGAAAVFDRAGLAHRRTEPVHPMTPIVPVGLGWSGDRHWVGIAPPFGWMNADGLRLLSRQMAEAGAVDLRLTPWRTLLVPGLTSTTAHALLAALTSSSASGPDAPILDPADARLTVAACSGAPACHRATTPVRADAERLAAALGPDRSPGIALHVSGCAKGCAHPGPAPSTLVGRDGLYDLVRHGSAGDRPVRRGLSAEAVAAMLRHPEPEVAC